MNNSSYERLRDAERIAKRAYRRFKSKLSKDERAGYSLFVDLVAVVKNSERFLLQSRVLEAGLEADPKFVSISALYENLKELDFDACAALNAKSLGIPSVDVFIHFVPEAKSFPVVRFFILDRDIFTASMTSSLFKSLMFDFFRNHNVAEIKADMVTLRHNATTEKDPDGRIESFVSLAYFVSSVIFEKPTTQGEQRHARISDCDYVRGPNGRYEAHNYYTYICEHSDAQDFRNSVREKRQAHGFTGTGGTKAFHYRQAHWRYYRELGKEVFVRGFFAGRKKPEVNVVR
ncbi:hypothetical protein B9057_01270 [Aestuarium zhoushanense]|nr:hypothetical protein B9057_01270 [Aestuarium zhoushanense]